MAELAADVPAAVPPLGDEAEHLDHYQLEGPRSRYTMTCIYHLYPTDTPAEHGIYEAMPEELRQLYINYEPPKRFLTRCSWKAEICPKTNRPHIQIFWETKNKKPTIIELLYYLGLSDRNACKFIHPFNPNEAWFYSLKEATTMPGAIPHTWGNPPPVGMLGLRR